MVEVCPICDIAGCHHIRERNAQGAKRLPDFKTWLKAKHQTDYPAREGEPFNAGLLRICDDFADYITEAVKRALQKEE